MKRSNDLSQLSKEEYDAMNDRDDSPLKYGMPKASSEELAGRRVVTVRKRPSTSDTPAGQPAFTAFANIGKSPFATVSLVAPTSTFPTQQPEQVADPFRGMSHLTLPQTSITAAASSSASIFTVPMPQKEAPKTIAAPSVESEYSKKMKKLNESFLGWAERQVKDNAIAIWKDGVKDYLKHQGEIAKKYLPQTTATLGAASVPSSSSVSVSSSVAHTLSLAPVPEPVVAAQVTNSCGPFDKTAPAALQPPAPASSVAPFKPFTLSSTNTGAFSLGTANSTAPSSTAASAPLFPAFNFPSTSSNVPGGSNGGGSGLFFPSTIGVGTATTGSTFFGSAPAMPVGGEDGGDGEGELVEEEPILAPEKVLRNENDKDIILVEAPAKLHNFSTELKEWRDTGKGTFRLTEDPATRKKRMVMRNGTGKITLNAAFFKGFKVERSKAGLSFKAFVAKEEGSSATEYKQFLLKLNDINTDKVYNLMEKIAIQLK